MHSMTTTGNKRLADTGRDGQTEEAKEEEQKQTAYSYKGKNVERV